MRRRSVLSSVGVLVFAGCTGSDGGGAGTTTTESTTTTSQGTTTTTPKRRVGESSLKVMGSRCGTRDAGGAEVLFEPESVLVTGTVVGSNGCYRARLGEVTYDSESDTCRVVVESFNASPNGVCTQCITTIDYEATVVFEDGVPGTVEVVHDDMGGQSTVVTANS